MAQAAISAPVPKPKNIECQSLIRPKYQEPAHSNATTANVLGQPALLSANSVSSWSMVGGLRLNSETRLNALPNRNSPFRPKLLLGVNTLIEPKLASVKHGDH